VSITALAITVSLMVPLSASGAGKLDPAFGTGGKVTTDLGGSDHAAGVAVNLAVARYLPTYCAVPKLRGRTLGTAKERLRSAHCAVGKIRRAYSKTVPKNQVVDQRPAPGARLAEQSAVGLTISRGRSR
jgi:beta-lactam-binding protein with PASTA domain